MCTPHIEDSNDRLVGERTNRKFVATYSASEFPIQQKVRTAKNWPHVITVEAPSNDAIWLWR